MVIDAHGETAGEGFHAQYVALLRDTGRMTAEELVQHRKLTSNLPLLVTFRSFLTNYLCVQTSA